MEDKVVLKQIKRYKVFSIAGIILLIGLIILQCYIIEENTYSCAPNSSVSRQEIDAFNIQFTSYIGSDSSMSEVRSLLTKLKAITDSYSDEPERVPGISYENYNGITLMNYKIENKDQFKQWIEEIRKNLKSKTTYTVEMSFGDSGFINFVKIKENENSELEENVITVELD